MCFASGKLTAGMGLDGTAFVKVPSQPKDRSAPFMQIHVCSMFYGESTNNRDLVKNTFHWEEEVDYPQ